MIKRVLKKVKQEVRRVEVGRGWGNGLFMTTGERGWDGTNVVWRFFLPLVFEPPSGLKTELEEWEFIAPLIGLHRCDFTITFPGTSIGHSIFRALIHPVSTLSIVDVSIRYAWIV